MAYSTKIKLSKHRQTSTNGSRLDRIKGIKNSKLSKPTKGWQKLQQKLKLNKSKKQKLRKFFYTTGGIFLVIVLIGMIFVLSYVQSISEDLPSPEEPFGKKASASEIYDRNGKLLYRVFGDANQDSLEIEQVPPLLKWAFLAAEDVDFYKHPGVDSVALARCAIKNVINRAVACGGSTITQQLIKLTALTNEQSYERKIKEILLALQIERVRTKDEILEMYLTVAPEGSNIYGITTAANFYFGKELKDLNLAEMAIIASIPQDPTFLSPTVSANPDQAKERVKNRQMYVLDQMAKYIDQINKSIKEQNNLTEDPLTEDMIETARNFKLKYRDPIVEIKAPHFVFYAQKLLQERDYNNGIPFTLSQLETGGYKIYTTLDLDYQQIAEQQVKKGVSDFGSKFGGENAALVALNPKNGEILSMVGSKDYFAKATPEGCTQGVDCKFEPNVNITDTVQSPGSSMKPMVFYMSIINGLITPGSIMADVPIELGPGGSYKPKNYEGGFTGLHSARWMLSQSRNIPAIMLVNQLGVDNFVKEMQKWGYDTLNNPAGYGPSIAVGGSDIKMIDHAEAYAVLANNGKYTRSEAILKILDKDNNEVYKYKAKSQQVADQRGVYLINDILNGKKGGPGDSWDGRDISGKTGTSEDQKETWFATYTPEIVTIGWLGNNNNTSMKYGASGFTSARPWIAEFVKLIGGSIPATPFTKPSGIGTKGVCTADESNPNGCDGFAGDLSIAGVAVPSYVQVSSALVCKDQKNRLAREIDIAMGLSVNKKFVYYKMIDPALQSFLDVWLKSKPEYGVNGVPTKYCNINRNPGGSEDPWAIITKPDVNVALTSTLDIDVTAFSADGDVTKVEVYLDGNLLGQSTTVPYVATFNIGNQSQGTHEFEVKVYDSVGNVGSTKVNLEVIGELTFNVPGSVSNGAVIDVSYNYSGASELTNIGLYVDSIKVADCLAGHCTWTVAGMPGTDVTVMLKGYQNLVLVQSESRTVHIN